MVKIPRKRVKNRDDMILEYCKGKKILHIGACDAPYTESKYNGEMGSLLYKKIDDVCKHQLGIDLDKTSIQFLNGKKFKNSSIKEFDMNNLERLHYAPDVIIFGETIEHLMNLGVAFTNLKKVMGKETVLIVSTPNCYALNSTILNLFGIEMFHEDHKVIFSYGILKKLLEFNGIYTTDFYFCSLPHRGSKIVTKIFDWLIDNIVTRLFPQLYYTLLFVCKIK